MTYITVGENEQAVRAGMQIFEGKSSLPIGRDRRRHGRRFRCSATWCGARGRRELCEHASASNRFACPGAHDDTCDHATVLFTNAVFGTSTRANVRVDALDPRGT